MTRYKILCADKLKNIIVFCSEQTDYIVSIIMPLLSGERTNMVTVMGDDVNGLCQERGQIVFFCQGGGHTGCLSRERTESLTCSLNVSYKFPGCSEYIPNMSQTCT